MQGLAWLFLVGATLLGFWAAGHLDTRAAGFGLALALAAAKVVVVFRSYMGLDRLGTPLQLFFYGWTGVCALVIASAAFIP